MRARTMLSRPCIRRGGALAATLGVSLGLQIAEISRARAAVPVTVRASVSASGGQARQTVDLAFTGGISDTGRYLLLSTRAGRLVPGDTNAAWDVFLRDAVAGRTTRMSVSSRGRQGNGDSFPAAISPDGRFVLFYSRASNLSRAADTNRAFDVFIRDRRRGITRRVSIRPGGGQFRGDAVSGFAGMSGDGRYVLFGVKPPHRLQRVYLRDRKRGTTVRIARRWRRAYAGGISANGRRIAYFAGFGLFIHDRATGRTVQVHTHLLPHLHDPVVFTPDGSEAAFTGFGLVSHTFEAAVWKSDGTVTQVTHGALGGEATSITDDGATIAFFSDDNTLVPGDINLGTDLFREDLTTGAVERLDLGNPASQLRDGVDQVAGNGLSGDNRWAAFATLDKLVPGDTNRQDDVYLRGPLN
jgi:Tol biopolymer transport system component